MIDDGRGDTDPFAFSLVMGQARTDQARGRDRRRFRAGGYWARDVGCAERGGGPVVNICKVICEVVAS